MVANQFLPHDAVRGVGVQLHIIYTVVQNGFISRLRVCYAETKIRLFKQVQCLL